jgi:hypothetical protein
MGVDLANSSTWMPHGGELPLLARAMAGSQVVGSVRSSSFLAGPAHLVVRQTAHCSIGDQG